MSIIAIANISNGVKIVGLRLLDTESKKVMDADIDSIYNSLINNKSTIENITIRNRKVVGSNGSIDRLPKIINGQLVGKSPLIIINQLGDLGYTVSDYKGQIISLKNADVIKYSKTNGIANGKVVNKDQNEFISAIEGTYETKELKNVCNTTVIEYEKVTGLLPLQVIIVDTFKDSTNIRFDMIKYRDGKFDIIKYKNISNEIKELRLKVHKSPIKYNKNLYKLGMYTLVGSVAVELDKVVMQTNQRSELIRIKSFRDGIESSIKRTRELHLDDYENLDHNTGLMIPSNRIQYEPIKFFIPINKNQVVYENIDKSEVKKYDSYLEIMRPPAHANYLLSYNKLALVKLDTPNIVGYKVLVVELQEKDGYLDGTYSIEDKSIYEIYDEAGQYGNVTIEGNDFVIAGMDACYKFSVNNITESKNNSLSNMRKMIQSL